MVVDGPRPIAQVARELDINETTLGNWVAAHRRSGHGSDPAQASGDRTEREIRLERENRKLREENEFLKKAAAFFAADNR